MPNLQHRPHTGDYDKWCDDTRPHPLNPDEWAELMAMPTIRDAWGLEGHETPLEFSAQVYAAKFHFHSGSPGYVGDLYVLQGDVLSGDPPFILLRGENGRLELA